MDYPPLINASFESTKYAKPAVRQIIKGDIPSPILSLDSLIIKDKNSQIVINLGIKS